MNSAKLHDLPATRPHGGCRDADQETFVVASAVATRSRRGRASGRAAITGLIALVASLQLSTEVTGQFVVLAPAHFRHYVETFNSMEDEPVANHIPNKQSWDWIRANVPFFACPAKRMEEIYYYRWWTYRKHIKKTPQGFVLTEFITPVRHAGPYNTISCALGHHLAEGRWLADPQVLDEYATFWFRSGERHQPAPHFHKYSSWAASALYQRYLVTGDASLLIDLLPDLVRDYRVWETERLNADGLFWQYDVRDGMEESISGGRRVQNVRPTINSYMVANARAIGKIAEIAKQRKISAEFVEKAQRLHQRMLGSLWDTKAEFFKVRLESGELSDAREAIGFVPWKFGLHRAEHAVAWKQLTDPQGFWAPCGITTAEQRHPEFRSHGSGTCEWDGAVWPFATSQTLDGLANFLRGPTQTIVTKNDYLDQLLRYANCHQQHGQAYLGEYLDEVTGEWLIQGKKAQRSRYYNHSTFNDLIISGLVGIVPSPGNQLTIHPLLPDNTWEWFCLDGVRYHGHHLSILWDHDGTKYDRGSGLSVWVDGKKVAAGNDLEPLTVPLPIK